MDCDYHSDFSKYNLELSHPAVFRGKLKSKFFNTENNICDSLGWGTNHSLASRSSTWETLYAISAAKRHTTDWAYLDKNISYFKKIVSYCRTHSLSLVLLTTPTWHTYYENLNKKQLDKMYSTIAQMQKEYDLPYYDYMRDSRFTNKDFYDGDHLNEFGATKFSRMIKQEIFDKLQ